MENRPDNRPIGSGSVLPKKGLIVSVIGAGISGLCAARRLADHGLTVRVYEKSRGTGGRLATRRLDGQSFDIGAQYFTASDRRFKYFVDTWLHQGLVHEWKGRIAVLNGRGASTKTTPQRYVGVPYMSKVSRQLAQGLNIAFQTRIIGVHHKGTHWQLTTEVGDTPYRSDVVIVAAPPEQAAPLLADVPQLAVQAKAVPSDPCWVVMARFDQPLSLPFEGVFLNSSSLSWATRDSSKPGRAGNENWIIHATGEWSALYLESEGHSIVETLLADFFRSVGVTVREPVFAQAHRWRFAGTRMPLNVECLWDPELRIGACGDWCNGSRVEGAALSGLAIAERVLDMSS